MERVAFLLEESNLRLSCMLNPESLEIQRAAGLRTRRSMGGVAASSRLTDDPLLSTGGGRTELTLDLLFDVGLDDGGQRVEDVRQLTRPLWELAENRDSEGDVYGSVPLVRFIWGMAWNVLGVVERAAERLERFSASGVPQRSWLRLCLRRVGEPIQEPTPSFSPDARLQLVERLESLQGQEPSEEIRSYRVQGEAAVEEYSADRERLDQICHRVYGDASLWPVVAAFNHLADPLRLSPDLPLRIPSRALLERLAREGEP